jgi:cation transport regulator ChaC
VRTSGLAPGAGIIDRIVSPRLALFAYGSLVSAASAERTLGRGVEHAGAARLGGWRRRWSLARDNLRSEKTFARPDGTTPPYCLGLNVEPGGGVEPNGALFEVSEDELDRLAVREIRYERIEVTGELALPAGAQFDRVFTFTAKREHFAPSPPAGAVIVATYALAVEAAFENLGPNQLEAFRASTGPYPVEVIEATLVRDRIPPGNPRDW